MCVCVISASVCKVSCTPLSLFVLGDVIKASLLALQQYLEVADLPLILPSLNSVLSLLLSQTEMKNYRS